MRMGLINNQLIAQRKNMYNWRDTPTMNYYYRESDGRIMGAAWHAALNANFYSSKIYTESFPFTNDCEKYIGHFIKEGDAKRSVEKYWLQQSNTLEYNNVGN